MAYLAAANVAVTLDPRDVDFLAMATKVSFPSIAFGDGNLQYPTHGVPLPVIGSFGMKKAIKRVFIQSPPGDGYDYKYDETYNTIRMYQTGAGTLSGNVAAPALTIAAPAANVAAPALTIAAPAANLNVVGGGTIAANDGVGCNAANLVKVNATNQAIPVTVAAPTGNLANVAVTVAAPTGNLANTAVTITGTAGAQAEIPAGTAIAATVLNLMVIGS